MLENIRTESTNQLSTDAVLVDATSVAGAVNIVVVGWNDAAPHNDGTPAFRLGPGANVTVRDSTVNRSASGSLAQESAYVQSVHIDNVGSGYTSVPTIQISAPSGSGATATANATISGGSISGVFVTAGGSGYQSPPSVSFSSGNAVAEVSPNFGNFAQPTAGWPPVLRLEDVVVNVPAASLCSFAYGATLVEVLRERLQGARGISPDVSTIFGRPRYSKLDWAILQRNAKNFWRLGEYGTAAVNGGWNQYSSNLLVNGKYNFPLTQNQQGIVITDGIGGFNTRNPVTGSPAGWVSFPASASSLGILSANAFPTWTLFGVVVRNIAGVYQVVFGNWNGTAGTGGFRIYFAANDSLNFGVDNTIGQTPTPVVATVTGPFAANTPVPFMVQINANSSPNLAIFTGGSTTPTGTASFPGSGYYNDPNVAPLIGIAVGAATPADLKIARIATWDTLLAGSDYQALYNAATS